jgi:hypothetical protein
MQCCGIVLGAVSGNTHECGEEFFAKVILVHSIRFRYVANTCKENWTGHDGKERDRRRADKIAQGDANVVELARTIRCMETTGISSIAASGAIKVSVSVSVAFVGMGLGEICTVLVYASLDIVELADDALDDFCEEFFFARLFFHERTFVVASEFVRNHIEERCK